MTVFRLIMVGEPSSAAVQVREHALVVVDDRAHAKLSCEHDLGVAIDLFWGTHVQDAAIVSYEMRNSVSEAWDKHSVEEHTHRLASKIPVRELNVR
jgi:hypothetical protein